MEPIKYTETEIDFMYDAMYELEHTGKTDKKCPRCGNELELVVSGSSASLACKTQGCLSVTRRGL